MKNDRPKPFVFFPSGLHSSHFGDGRTVMAAAAGANNLSWLTGQACPSGVYDEWVASECSASQTSVASTNCFSQ